MSARQFQVLVLITAFSPALVHLLLWDIVDSILVFLLYSFASISIPILLTHAVKRDLRARGYEWLGFWEAVEYVKRFGTKTSNVPQRDEMQMIPGYKDGSVESLCKCLAKGLGVPVREEKA